MCRGGGDITKQFHSFAAPRQAAGGPEGGHFVPRHGPLTEEPGPNEAR